MSPLIKPVNITKKGIFMNQKSNTKNVNLDRKGSKKENRPKFRFFQAIFCLGNFFFLSIERHGTTVEIKIV